MDRENYFDELLKEINELIDQQKICIDAKEKYLILNIFQSARKNLAAKKIKRFLDNLAFFLQSEDLESWLN